MAVLEVIERNHQMARRTRSAAPVARPANPTIAAMLAAARRDGNLKAEYAIMDAETNATDTIAAGDGAADDAERLTHDSIAYTAVFNEQADVRDWFQAQGYRW
jgi:hypothetical protein